MRDIHKKGGQVTSTITMHVSKPWLLQMQYLSSNVAAILLKGRRSIQSLVVYPLWVDPRANSGRQGKGYDSTSATMQ